MRKAINVLRYEQVLEMLEDGPIPDSELIENLEDKYPKKHILDVLARMSEKGYVKTSNGLVHKTKDLFYKEL